MACQLRNLGLIILIGGLGLLGVPGKTYAEHQHNVELKIGNINFPMPRSINNLTTTPGSRDGEINLQWTEPGAYGNSGIASSYTIKISTLGNIDDPASFDAASPLSLFSGSVIPAPGPASSILVFVATGLIPGDTYYFAVEAINAEGRRGLWFRGGPNNINQNNRAEATDLFPSSPTAFTATSWMDDVRLAWNQNPEIDIDYYRVYRSTQNPPQAELWASTKTTRLIDETVIPGTTYYYRVGAVDWKGREGAPTDWINVIPEGANFAGAAVSPARILWTWDDVDSAIGYRVYSSTGGAALKELPASVTNWLETGLAVNAAYSRYLKAFDGVSESAQSPAITRYTYANTPAKLQIAETTDIAASMIWDANNNPPGTFFTIGRSLDGASYSDIAAKLTATSYTATNLEPDTVYYFRVRAYNHDEVPTEFANIASTRTLKPIDRVPPAQVHGLYGKLSEDNNNFTLYWSSVTRDIKGSTETVTGYNLYRSTDAQNSYAAKSTTPIPATTYTDLISGGLYYYKVRAVDLGHNESEDSLILDTKLMANIIAQEKGADLVLPATALAGATNTYGKDLKVNIVNKEEEENGVVYRSVRFAVMGADNGQIVENFLLPSPQAEVVLRYSVIGGQVAAGYGATKKAPQSAGGPVAAVNAADNLALYWFDGVKWIKLGGKVNTARQNAGIKTAHGGHYQLRKVARAGEFRIDAAGQSHKIFTPNGDGWNDHVLWRFENPQTLEVSGKIYDLEGAYVADLKPGVEENSMMWDGKDDGGRGVRSGIYIFQIKAGGTVFNGTVVVAK